MDERAERPGSWSRALLRWSAWPAVALVVIAFLLVNRGEWRSIGDAARQARPSLLALAALLQGGWMLFFGVSFWAGLTAAGVRLPFRSAVVASWACNFLNMVVKSGGMSGLAVFLRMGRRRGQSGSRVTLGYLLTLALGYAAFLCVLAVTLVLLSRQRSLRTLELGASASIAVVLLAVVIGLFSVLRSQRGVQRGYEGMAGLVNRITGRVLRRPLLDPEGGVRVAAESEAIMRLVREHPTRLLPSALASLGKDLCGVAVLYLVLRAFHDPVTPALALTAYALTIVFSYISIVPSGLGIVEVSLTGVLIRAGVPPAEAALSTVVFRLFQFWTPFLAGAVATRFTGGAPRDMAPADQSASRASAARTR